MSGGAVPPGLAPQVFLGPSAPREDVTGLLPGATIHPPVRRGDLHRLRLLRFSVFVIIDGVFAGQDAISPREVVDVLEDGAAVLGAASMGALRAADCAPKGAQGFGHIHRLFSRRVLDSEDEVAVVFRPEAPWPALTEPLVSIRIAARRAQRGGMLTVAEAEAVVAAARALHYEERSWRAILCAAGLEDRVPALRPALAKHDVKRADVRLCLAHLARRLAAEPGWGDRARQSRRLLGLDTDDRQRPPAPLGAASRATITPGLVLWLCLSGRAACYLPPGAAPLERLDALGPAPAADWTSRLDRLDPKEVSTNPSALASLAETLWDGMVASGDLDAELFRYRAVSEAMRRANTSSRNPEMRHIRLVEHQLAIAHRATDWQSVVKGSSSAVTPLLATLRVGWAKAKAGTAGTTRQRYNDGRLWSRGH